MCEQRGRNSRERFQVYDAQAKVRLIPIEVGFVMKQGNTVFDAPRSDQTVNCLAHGYSFTPQHTLWALFTARSGVTMLT